MLFFSSRGGKALAAALTTSNGAWYSVPLLPEKPYENDDLLIDSPLLEDHDAVPTPLPLASILCLNSSRRNYSGGVYLVALRP